MALLQLISAASEHSMLRAWENYGLENVVFLHFSLWAVQTINFLYVLATRNVKTHLQKSTVFTLEAWWQYYSSCHVRANLDTLEPKCVELE